jgi:hypothetical protein
MLTSRSLIVGLLTTMGLTAYVSANHAWGDYHWARTSNPFTLQVIDSVTPAWDAYLDEALADWTASSVLDLTKTSGNSGVLSRWLCSPASGRIKACNYTYGNNGWLGIAQVWVDGSHITQATTKLNDTYFNTPAYNAPEWRRLVTCQEIAHGFGLDHQDEDFSNPNLGTCMDYTDNPAGPPSNEHPDGHDYAELEIIYEHLDSTSTANNNRLPSLMPPAMGQIDFAGPDQWGRLVASIANGRVQLYQLDFGGGHQVLTHVIWAVPPANVR